MFFLPVFNCVISRRSGFTAACGQIRSWSCCVMGWFSIRPGSVCFFRKPELWLCGCHTFFKAMKGFFKQQRGHEDPALLMMMWLKSHKARFPRRKRRSVMCIKRSNTGWMTESKLESPLWQNHNVLYFYCRARKTKRPRLLTGTDGADTHTLTCKYLNTHTHTLTCRELLNAADSEVILFVPKGNFRSNKWIKAHKQGEWARILTYTPVYLHKLHAFK